MRPRDGSQPLPKQVSRRSSSLWCIRVLAILFALHTVLIANSFSRAAGGWPEVRSAPAEPAPTYNPSETEPTPDAETPADTIRP